MENPPERQCGAILRRYRQRRGVGRSVDVGFGEVEGLRVRALVLGGGGSGSRSGAQSLIEKCHNEATWRDAATAI